MKKLLLLLVAAVVSFTTVSAQEAGQWTIGPRANIYTNTGDGAILGLGAFARYNLTDAWRLEPGITALFHSYCSIDVNCDVHYMFELTRNWSLYPVAGVTVSDIGKWAVGMNVGVGTDFAVASKWDLTAGVKWMPVFDSARKNPIVITIGGCYKF